MEMAISCSQHNMVTCPSRTRVNGVIVVTRSPASRGFTLTEMMIVIAITLLISIASIPLLLPALNERKVKDATGTLQAALIGARDRAISSGQIRGLRLVRSPSNGFDVTSLEYVGSPEPYALAGPVDVVAGGPSLPGLGTNYSVVSVNSLGVDPHWETIGTGPDGKPGRALVDDDSAGGTDDVGELGAFGSDDVFRVDRNGQAFIRFNGIGPYYQIVSVFMPTGSPPFGLRVTPVAPAMTAARYQIHNPPAPLPDTKPIALPDGVVIDVRANLPSSLSTHPFYNDPRANVPRSRFIANQIPSAVFLAGLDGTYGNADDPPPALWPAMDILFAPNGMVVGTSATSPVVHFWIGERGDTGQAGADGVYGNDPMTAPNEAADDVAPRRVFRLVTLLTRTGAVQVYEHPDTTGTRPNFPEIYGTVENLIGQPKKKAAE